MATMHITTCLLKFIVAMGKISSGEFSYCINLFSSFGVEHTAQEKALNRLK
jgi:hypothetical protein